MRKHLKLLCLAMVAVLLMALLPAGAQGVSGVFEGVGKGRGGEIHLEVTLENGAIKDIKVLEQGETLV